MIGRHSHSILRKNRLAIVVVSVFCVTILLSVFMSLNSYHHSLNFYTEIYYQSAEFSLSVKDFEKLTLEYSEYEESQIGDGFRAQYNDLHNEFYEIKKYKTRYNSTIQGEIDSIDQCIEVIKSVVNHMGDVPLGNPSDSVAEIQTQLTAIEEHMVSLLSEFIELGNQNYDTQAAFLVFLEVLILVASMGTVMAGLWFIFYLRRRILAPIKEISEWASLFREGYTEMEELQYDSSDEIGDLVDSFNIVRRRLMEANGLKKEYEVLTRKLKDEESYKKKFVQQLYVEKREKETISSEAKRDSLTGLLNRRSFDTVVDDFIAKKPGGQEGALFLIDMDNFKQVNDTLGHPVGDEALKILAGCMRIVLPGGYLGRYGGDEFIAFIHGTITEKDILLLGNELCEKMNREISGELNKAQLSVSVGIATSKGVREYSELYMNADKALYYAKEHGRNQATLFSKIEDQIIGD